MKFEGYEKQRTLPFGSTKPGGWLYELMTRDLESGFVGHLDQLVPDLIVEDDIYGEDRLSKIDKKKDVGTEPRGEDWEVQFLWWNSETQSNWWDGYIRNVLLTGNEQRKEKVLSYVSNKLSTQDSDGYIGIYGEDLRFSHNSENGELWSQASLFRGLLAYYLYSNDVAAFNAVETAVKKTMSKYPIGESRPFDVHEPLAGVGHGLTFTDILDTLYKITNDTDYLDYAAFLFKDYDSTEQPEKDIQTKSLKDSEYKLADHGVHTYEHLRSLVYAASHTRDEELTRALNQYLIKLEKVLLPSGAPLADEWIFEREADPDNTGYEYCGIQELLHSYVVLLEKTGAKEWADRIEWLVFNGALASRAPDNKSLAYCNTDNCYDVCGHLDPKKPQNEMRYKYSGAHQDVAVCCAPNAGRVFPYYVQSFLSLDEDGIAVNLFGPSSSLTQLNGKMVTVAQDTFYPADFKIGFAVSCDTETEFTLSIRIPDWADNYSINISDCAKRLDEASGCLRLDGKWRGTTCFDIEFFVEPKIERFKTTAYLRHGPLLFALPIDYTENNYNKLRVEGFTDKFFNPKDNAHQNYVLSEDENFKVAEETSKGNIPFWDKVLIGNVWNDLAQEKVKCEFKPIAYSVLRKVCFPVKDCQE